MSIPPDYAPYGNVNPYPSAQNPTIIPAFDPLVGGSADGSVFDFQSIPQFLANYPRVSATGTITFTGSVTTGDTATLELFNGVFPNGTLKLSTLALAGDTLALIAIRLMDAVNTNFYCMAQGVTATYSVVGGNPVITLEWPGPVGNITAVGGWSYAATATATSGGTVTAGDVNVLMFQSLTMPTSQLVLKLGGSAVTGDVLKLNFNNASFTGTKSASFTVGGTQTLTAAATGLAAAINAASALTAIGMAASSLGPKISITWNPAYGDVQMLPPSFTHAATEILTLAGQAGTPPSALAPSPLGAETLTVTGTATTGDLLTLQVAASGMQNPVSVPFVVPGGATTTTIATAIAAAINANANLLAAGFAATSLVNVVTITWSNLAGVVNFNATAVGVPPETLTTGSGNPHAILYTSAGGNTTTDIATALKNAINADVICIQAGIIATSSSAVISIFYNNNLAPLAITGVTNGVETVTVGGAPVQGDIVKLTITNASLPGGATTYTYTVGASPTTSTVATALAALLTADANLAAIGITASPSTNTVLITSVSTRATTYSRVSSNTTLTLSGGATETLVITGNPVGQTLTVGGTITNNDVVTLTFTDPGLPGGVVNVTAKAVTADTVNTLAAKLNLAIQASEALFAGGITSTVASAVITVVSTGEQPVITSAVSGGATETITVGDNNFGTEILTAVSPLAGGAGPIIPIANFQFAQNNDQSGSQDVSAGTFTDFWRGKPVLVDYGTVTQMVAAGMPIK